MARNPHRKVPGIVHLVGGGPGDPELVTQKGLRLIESADVIFYDALAPTELLSHRRPEAHVIYVGKKRTQHAYSQQEISDMMIVEARAGKKVVRLKGGDPFMFGRGGEEAEALRAAGVRFEVVPGVTSALGVAAYSGIPLTHRRYTSAVTFVTGHEADQVDWSKLGTTGTLVIFMGLTTFAEVSRRLIQCGRAPSTPAAAIRWGTRGDQITVEGTLENLPDKIRHARLKPPALIVVGEVVSLRRELNWFEELPLVGSKVVVTRARGQAERLSGALRLLGATVIELPTIEIRPPNDWSQLDQAIAQLEQYDWLIFTSANGVRYFIERLDASKRDLRALKAKICAIGPATAEHLEGLHLKVDLMPSEYVAESVLEAFGEQDLEGKLILLPRATVARDLIPVELKKRGAEINVVPAYRTQVPKHSAELAQQTFNSDPRPDWITFTSSSTVRNFAQLCPIERLNGVRVASIGPITSKTARELGIRVDAEPERYTVEGLVEAIVSAQEK